MTKIYTIIIITLVSINSLLSQCYPDRHSTSVFDSWVSDAPSANPNTARAASHWIMYDFGANYNLGQMHLWNINDPDRLDQGINNYTIDISLDGITWEEIGQFSLEQAAGLSVYEGAAGPDLEGKEAKYLLVTAIDNHGNQNRYGLGEIRIELSAEALSIALVDFAIDCNEENIAELSWRAVNNGSSDYFIIEESIDNDEWAKIAEIKTINSSTEELYEFSNESDEREVMYRLSIVDNNGETQLLKIATALCNKLKDFEINPNPFSTDAVVKLHGFENQDVTYTINDMLGRTVQKGTISILGEGHTFKLENSQLTSGQYTMVINDGSTNYHNPFVYIGQK